MLSLSKLRSTIIPVVVIKKALSPKAAKKLVSAVIAGGSHCLEITLRTPEGLQAIKMIKQQCPDFIVGAGTVLTTEQVKQSLAAGADFLVSPGLSLETVEAARANNTVIIPGVITPTEIQQAISMNLELVKFFPAEQAGGVAMLKALASVYPDVQIMPTGGIKQANLSQYTALPNVFAVGGSWVCSSQDIADENYNNVTTLLKAANAEFIR